MGSNSDNIIKMFGKVIFVFSFIYSLTAPHFIIEALEPLEDDGELSTWREGVVTAEKTDEFSLSKMWGKECLVDVQCSSIAVCLNSAGSGSPGWCTPNSMARIILGGMVSLVFLLFLLIVTLCCSYTNFAYCPCVSYLCF